MTISRRGLLSGLVGLIAAPAIVRVASLMPVKAWMDDGVALNAMRHPWSNVAGRDLTEDSLMEMMLELSGFDAYGQPVIEMITLGRPSLMKWREIGGLRVA